MNTSRNPKSLYDSMVEYSFDNSLVNSHNSKRLSQLAGHNTPGKEPLHKLSAFSESQGFQNFVKRKTQKYEDTDNIYTKKYDFGREMETYESSADMKKLIDKIKTDAEDHEEKHMNTAKHNIYRNIIRKLDDLHNKKEKAVNNQNGVYVDRSQSKDKIREIKNNLFTKKKPLINGKQLKVRVSNPTELKKMTKPICTSTKSKLASKPELYTKRKYSGTSVRDFEKLQHDSYNSGKRLNKNNTINIAHSMKELPASQIYINSISIEKPRKISTRPELKRNLSSNPFMNNVQADYKFKTINNKEKPFKAAVTNNSNNKETTRLFPRKRSCQDVKPRYFVSASREHKLVEKSKEKLQKSLKKMQKYRKLKQDYVQKLVKDTKALTKRYKPYTTNSLPSEGIWKSHLKKAAMVECTEYKGDIRSLFDQSNSNNTTGKSIEHLENLVNRIYNHKKG